MDEIADARILLADISRQCQQLAHERTGVEQLLGDLLDLIADTEARHHELRDAITKFYEVHDPL